METKLDIGCWENYPTPLRCAIGRFISLIIGIEVFKSRIEVILPELGSDVQQVALGIILLFWSKPPAPPLAVQVTHQ